MDKQENHKISLDSEIRLAGGLDAERRVFDVEGTDGARAGEGYDFSVTRDGNVTGLRVGPIAGGGFAADLESGERVSVGARDKKFTGESRALPTCKILVDALNRAGHSFTAPIPANPAGRHSEEPGYDCLADEPGGTLLMQHTRAVRDKKFWRGMNEDRIVHDSATVDQLALSLAETARAKQRKLGQPGITLVLDATQHIGALLPRVVARTRELYGGELAGLGFAAVWLVGPSPDRCHRLDSQ